MHLSHLSLSNFRNYEQARFEFDPHTNVIYGKNGEGKTNILEAIFLLGTLQSFRSNDHKSLIQLGKEEARISGRVERDGLEKNLSLSLVQSGKRANVNEKRVNKVSDYFGLFYVISFNPMDLHILQGGPQGRRQCLDRMLLNFDPGYRHELMSYYRALLQRNAALKFGGRDMVTIWWEKVSKIGAKIIFKRLQFIQKLTRLTSDQYQKISGIGADVAIQYQSTILLNDFNRIGVEDLVGLLDEKQLQIQDEEQRAKRTLVGPHRDDFSITVNGNDLRKFGSQGEHRTAILALKLSEVVALEEESGTRAIVLLDDIASELDETRRSHLFELLKEDKTQIFVTTTDTQTVSLLKKKSKFFHIEGGYLKDQ